jgi:hypothetical protein
LTVTHSECRGDLSNRALAHSWALSEAIPSVIAANVSTILFMPTFSFPFLPELSFDFWSFPEA